MRKILIIAAPTALASSLPPVSTAFTNWMLVVYGNAAVAANSIAMRVETVPFMAIFALSSVLSSFIGQNWGAKNIHRVQVALKKSFLFSYLLGLVSAALLITYRQSISACFDSSPQVVEITGLYFSLVPITYGLLGSVFLTTHSLNAIGRPLSGNLLSASRLVLIYFPLTYILNFYFSVGGIFAARLIANSIVGIFAAVLVYQVFFKMKEAVQPVSELPKA